MTSASLELPSPPLLRGLPTWLLSPHLPPGCSPFPHSAASREAHVSPPPSSPNTSCSSAFLLPTTVFCCYGNREAVLAGGGVLEHSHCWPWCGREMVGRWRRRRGESGELRVQTQPVPGGERDLSPPPVRWRKGRGRAAQGRAGLAAASLDGWTEGGWVGGPLGWRSLVPKLLVICP